jgi:hypothetical protein
MVKSMVSLAKVKPSRDEVPAGDMDPWLSFSTIAIEGTHPKLWFHIMLMFNTLGQGMNFQ